AVDLRFQAVLRVEKLGVWARGSRRARHRDEQALEITIEAERQFCDLLAFKQPSCVSAVGLQYRRRARFNRDGLSEGTDLHCQVYTDGRVDIYSYILAHDLLEAFQRSFNSVNAILDIREDVVAILIGSSGECDVGAHFSSDDSRARCCRAVRIGDG